MSPLPGAGRAEQLAQAVAERVVGLVLEAIDLDALLARVDVDGLIDRVDVDKIVARVDVDAIVERVDIDQLIARVDVDELIGRVDVKKLVDRIDIDALVEQTEVGTIIARSTSGVASEALDLVRAQGVGLDDFVARWVDRILRRRTGDWPAGPPVLVGTPPGTPEEGP